MNRTVFVIVAIALLASACSASSLDMKVPLKGGSVANTKLQYDTLMPVYTAVGTFVDGCKNMSVFDTKVTKEPYDLKQENGTYVDGKWEELWSVNACGAEVAVPVKFVLDPTGATYIVSLDEIVVNKK